MRWLSRLMGRRYSAQCLACGWNFNEYHEQRIRLDQARFRAVAHMINAHRGQVLIGEIQPSEAIEFTK